MGTNCLQVQGFLWGDENTINTGDGCPNLSLYYCKNHCIVYSNGGIIGFVSCSSRKLLKKKNSILFKASLAVSEYFKINDLEV